MKKFLVLMILVCAPQLYAGTSVANMTVLNISGNVVEEEASCADCSGSLAFAWYGQDLTIDDDTDTPCGCTNTNGDNEAAASGTATISSSWGWDTGDESLHCADGLDYVTIDNSNSALDGILDEGKIIMVIRLVTWVDNAMLFNIWNNPDEIKIYMDSNVSAIDFTVKVGGVETKTSFDYDFNTTNPQTFKIEAEWIEGVGGNDAKITAWYWNGSAWAGEGSGTSDTDWSPTNAQFTDMEIGNASSGNAEYYIGLIEIYDDTSFD